MEQRRHHVPDQVRAYHWRFPWSSLDTCCCGCWPVGSRSLPNLLAERLPLPSSFSPDIVVKLCRSLGALSPGDGWAVFAAPVTLLAEGRSYFLSLISPDLDVEQRRSLGGLLGDGWADFAAPVTLLAEGRLCAASVYSGRNLQPPSDSPMWRPFFFCLEARTVRLGSLAVPSGNVPGDDEVDSEQIVGSDRVSELQFEVLYVNVQGHVLYFLYVLGPDVIRCVLPFPN